ncbi:hypothetical protein EVAR_17952_1 [Eumeta japonica]|uniref:Uncharacterized protein n=1 Tax=Eumeta variegata TaxID=151549 RepID=A0A4C1UZT4_EUMVA|nr:hypothetical protein EVAR_17952_1 [Eumeta japonica]
MSYRDVQFIPTEKGKHILVLRGFTYSQVGGRFFYCSSKHMGCKARVRVAAGRLVEAGERHNHPPPSHARCGNGAFVQLRPRALVAPAPPASPLHSLTPPLLPLLLSARAPALLASHTLSFPRIMPKLDLWQSTSKADDKK